MAFLAAVVACVSIIAVVIRYNKNHKAPLSFGSSENDTGYKFSNGFEELSEQEADDILCQLGEGANSAWLANKHL